MQLRKIILTLSLATATALGLWAQDMPTVAMSESFMPEGGWPKGYLTHDEITYYCGQYALNGDTTIVLLVDLVEDHLQLVMPNGDEFEMKPAGNSIFYFDTTQPDRLYFYRKHWRDPWRMHILTTGGRELEAIQTHDEDY